MFDVSLGINRVACYMSVGMNDILNRSQIDYDPIFFNLTHGISVGISLGCFYDKSVRWHMFLFKI